MQFTIAFFAALAAASPMIAERAAEPAAVANSPTSYDPTYNNGPSYNNNPTNPGRPVGGNSPVFNGRQFRCPGLLQTPQCCQTDVLDLLSLTCEPPRSDVFSRQSFKAECASTGTTANCCVLPVLGQGLICQDV